MIRGALVALFRFVMRLYFRRIERLGPAPDAGVRGRVICANHYNALIDPVVVITEAECEVAPIAKSTLWSIVGLGWLLDAAGAVPIVRRKDAPDKDAAANDAAFARIAAHLAGGGNVLIFPEGVSHSASRLAPVKRGAARMMEAAAALGGVAPTYQACALEFDAADLFRSRCLVVWGPVRALADVPGTGDARVRATTAAIEADLAALLVEGDTHDQRRLICRVAELVAHDLGDASLAAWSEVGRQVEEASKLLRARGDAAVARVDAAVTRYYDALARAGVRDVQLARGRTLVPRVSPARWVRRVLLAPLALAGVILYALPYRYPRHAARKVTPDTVSTIKLGAGLVVFPLWAIALAIVAWISLPAWAAALATAVIVASPFAALRWLDWRDLRARSLSEADTARLAALRAEAVAAIDATRDRFEKSTPAG